MELDVFAAVPERELRLAARRRRFSRGEVVFHRDDPGDSVHRVESGRFAARIVTSRGNAATIAIYGPGEVFGLLAVVGAEPRRTATVLALEEGETLALPGSAVLRLRESYPGIHAAVERLLAAQLAETNERLVEALFTPAADRVRRRLEALAEVYEERSTGEVVIPLSQEHLADLAGTTRETVNRVLKQEEERGGVRLARNRIVVVRAERDPERRLPV